MQSLDRYGAMSLDNNSVITQSEFTHDLDIILDLINLGLNAPIYLDYVKFGNLNEANTSQGTCTCKLIKKKTLITKYIHVKKDS